MQLFPSILTDSFATLQKQLTLVKSHPDISVVQIDIIDGQFADNVTISPSDLVETDFGKLEIDLHLMTEEPLDFVLEAVEFKNRLPIRAVIAQVERMSYQAEYLAEVKKHNWQAGLSLDLHTPVEAIDLDSWEVLDFVQLMTIEAGFQGQEFKEQALKKVKEIHEFTEKFERKIKIIVDGGVKPEHVKILKKHKIDGVGVGSGLWKADDINQAIQDFNFTS